MPSKRLGLKKEDPSSKSLNRCVKYAPENVCLVSIGVISSMQEKKKRYAFVVFQTQDSFTIRHLPHNHAPHYDSDCYH